MILGHAPQDILPMWPRFKSRRRPHMRVEFVVGSLLCSVRLIFRLLPSPQKPTLPNSNSTRNQVDEEPLCGCATSKSLSIYLILPCCCRECQDFYMGKQSIKQATITMSRHLNLKCDHFLILARGRSDTHCKIKKTLLIKDLNLH